MPRGDGHAEPIEHREAADDDGDLASKEGGGQGRIRSDATRGGLTLRSLSWNSRGPPSNRTSGRGPGRWPRTQSSASVATTTRGSTATRRSSPASSAAHGWIGMTWPVSRSGPRPSARSSGCIVGEELDRGRRADRRVVVRRPPDGPDTHRLRHGRISWPRSSPASSSGETTWCIGMSEPDARLDLAGLQTRAMRDGDEWVINGQKIWTSFGAVADYCYLICRTGTDGPTARRHQRDHRADGHAGHRGAPDPDLTGNRHFCEVFFHGRAGAGRQPRRRRGRRVQADDAPARARAGWDRPPGLQPGAVPRWRSSGPIATDPLVRQEIAHLETGYRLGRLLVSREVLGQAPTGLQRRHEVLLHGARDRRSPTSWPRVLGLDATLGDPRSRGLPTRRATRSWVAPRT